MTGQIVPCLMAIAASAVAASDYYYDYSDTSDKLSTSYEDNLLSGLEWGFKLGSGRNKKSSHKSVYSDDSDIYSALLPTLNPRAKSTPRRQLFQPTRLKSTTVTTPTTTTTQAPKISRTRTKATTRRTKGRVRTTNVIRRRTSTTPRRNDVINTNLLKNHKLEEPLFPILSNDRGVDEFVPSIRLPPLFVPSKEIPTNPTAQVLNDNAIHYDDKGPDDQNLWTKFPSSLNEIVGSTNAHEVRTTQATQKPTTRATTTTTTTQRLSTTTLKSLPITITRTSQRPQRPHFLFTTRRPRRPPPPKPPRRPSVPSRLKKALRQGHGRMFTDFYRKLRRKMAEVNGMFRRRKYLGKRRHRRIKLDPPETIRPKRSQGLKTSKQVLDKISQFAVTASEMMLYVTSLHG